MPAKKKRNNKPKSAKNIITIHQSSTTFQSQEISRLNFPVHQQEQTLIGVSAMEDSSNGKVDDDHEYKEVPVGDSKTAIAESAEETTRDVSILDEIVHTAEKIFDRDSSSSTSSDDEKEPEPEPEVKDVKEETSSVDATPIAENFVSIVETKLESVEAEAEPGLAEEEEAVSKVVEENVGVVSSIESSGIVQSPSPQIPETTPDNPACVPVTRDSLQANSWKSCCGLFEVFRRSER